MSISIASKTRPTQKLIHGIPTGSVWQTPGQYNYIVISWEHYHNHFQTHARNLCKQSYVPIRFARQENIEIIGYRDLKDFLNGTYKRIE